MTRGNIQLSYLVGLNCLVEDFIPNSRVTIVVKLKYSKMKLLVSIAVLCFAFTSALYIDNIDDIAKENELAVFPDEFQDESIHYEAQLDEFSNEIDDRPSHYDASSKLGLHNVLATHSNI